jgi:hypothetical protein
MGTDPANEEAPNPGLVDYWLAFTRNHDRNDAVKQFKLRFKTEPRQIFVYKVARLLLIGPEPEEI